MQYYYYRGEEKNFGDELNHHLLPKILPDFFDNSSEEIFLGIGSILFDTHPQKAKKVVLGSGYGGYTPKPRLDSDWRVYGVRGPRTAAALGLDPSLVIADLAVMLFRERKPEAPKRHPISFMPHFQSLARGNWQEAAAQAGIHFIDPRRDVSEILADITASEVILAEAMHGAIVADALRVPWIALLPLDASHRFKWFDWAEALDLKLQPQAIRPSTFYEWADNFRIAGKSIKRLSRHMEEPLKAFFAERFTSVASKSLLLASKASPQLSADSRIESAVSRFDEAIYMIRRDFPSHDQP